MLTQRIGRSNVADPAPWKERGFQLEYLRMRAIAKVYLTLIVLAAGCPSLNPPPQGTMESALRAREGAAPQARDVGRPEAKPKPPKSKPDSSLAATVNGRGIPREQIVDLLLRSHGAGMLEQVIALAAAEELAERKGLSITNADVDREYVLALRRVSNPLSPPTADGLDRAAAERLLESVLAERNISRDEFFLTLRRNAYLREVVEQENPVTDAELRAEYARRFGERVQVRHIQLASPGDAERVHERLANGEDFAELAKKYSANAASARQGGLLDPFSEHDEAVPAVFRQTAFALQPGEVSGIVRAAEWHHFIRLERRIPEEQRPFQEVIGELTSGVRERTSEARMRERYETLVRESAIEIHDAVLREAYERRKARASPGGG